MKTEETIRDFVEYLRFQHCEPPDWKENVSLMALEITNNSANDYYRNPTGDEIEELIVRYLAARQPEFTPGSELAELNEMDAKHPGQDILSSVSDDRQLPTAPGPETKSLKI